MAEADDKKPQKAPKEEKKTPKETAVKKQGDLFNRALNLIVLVLIAYGMFSYFTEQEEPTPETTIAGVAETLGDKMELDPSDPRIEQLYKPNRMNLASRLMPVSRPAVATTVIEEGDGPAALCGQQVSYQVLDGEENEALRVVATESFRLGETNQKPIGYTLGIEGMRPGEVRQLVIPPVLWKENPEDDDKEVLVRKVKLLSAEPETAFGEMGLRRFVIHGGGASMLRCGDIAAAHLSIWDMNGSKIFDSRDQGNAPVWFELGKGQAPFGIELGAQQMVPGGRYTLIVPPQMIPAIMPPEEGWQPPAQYAVQSFPKDIPLPADRAIMVDLLMMETMPHKELEAPALSNPHPSP